MNDFIAFPKIARLNREIIVTEKIDGTNAQIFISDDSSEILAGSRTRWITPDNDNYGFARWVEDNKAELLQLGPGHHYGEWWGAGIQRRYNQTEKHFSLFNVQRWARIGDGGILPENLVIPPACCSVVPVLYYGSFDAGVIRGCLTALQELGSFAGPGFMNPEGIVIYHTAARTLFKVTLEKDESPKGPQQLDDNKA